MGQAPISGFHTHKYPNGDVFIGNYLDSQRTGIGELTTQLGDKYNGSWVRDKKHGHGTMIYHHAADNTQDTEADAPLPSYIPQDQNSLRYRAMIQYRRYKHQSEIARRAESNVYLGTYVGHWLSDKRNGFGLFTYHNGDIYHGEWHNDKRNGKGLLSYASYDEYEGLYRNNIADGWGIVKLNCQNKNAQNMSLKVRIEHLRHRVTTHLEQQLKKQGNNTILTPKLQQNMSQQQKSQTLTKQQQVEQQQQQQNQSLSTDLDQNNSMVLDITLDIDTEPGLDLSLSQTSLQQQHSRSSNPTTNNNNVLLHTPTNTPDINQSDSIVFIMTPPVTGNTDTNTITDAELLQYAIIREHTLIDQLCDILHTYSVVIPYYTHRMIIEGRWVNGKLSGQCLIKIYTVINSNIDTTQDIVSPHELKQSITNITIDEHLRNTHYSIQLGPYRCDIRVVPSHIAQRCVDTYGQLDLALIELDDIVEDGDFDELEGQLDDIVLDNNNNTIDNNNNIPNATATTTHTKNKSISEQTTASTTASASTTSKPQQNDTPIKPPQQTKKPILDDSLAFTINLSPSKNDVHHKLDLTLVNSTTNRTNSINHDNNNNSIVEITFDDSDDDNDDNNTIINTTLVAPAEHIDVTSDQHVNDHNIPDIVLDIPSTTFTEDHIEQVPEQKEKADNIPVVQEENTDNIPVEQEDINSTPTSPTNNTDDNNDTKSNNKTTKKKVVKVVKKVVKKTNKNTLTTPNKDDNDNDNDDNTTTTTPIEDIKYNHQHARLQAEKALANFNDDDDDDNNNNHDNMSGTMTGSLFSLDTDE